MRWSQATLLLVCLVMQTSILPHVAPAGINPDLVLVVTVLMGLHSGPREGFWWGALGGLLMDLSFGRFMGFNIAVKAIAAYVAGYVGLKVYRHNPGVPGALGGAATFIQELLMYGILRLYGLQFPFVVSMTDIILPHALVNVFLAALLSPLVFRVFSRPGVAVEG